ncbi:MAG: hypothetical protein A2Y97_12935 [Nitrospirae bacterium RBG_13_39_12]|nr:MAG: hypothetical protein A2Y97_12935 [Nitrospirae bacterium RBG_13_39_12]
MVSKCQAYISKFYTLNLPLKYSLILIVLMNMGCTVALTSITPKEDRLYLAGNFGEVVQYLEGERGRLSPNERSRILNENINRMRAHQFTTYEFIYYQLDANLYIRSLIQLGYLEKALRFCDESLRERNMIAETIRRYNYKKTDTSTELNTEAIKSLNILKGYIIWLMSGDSQKALSYFSQSMPDTSVSEESISWVNLSGKNKIRFLSETGEFLDKVMGDYRKALENYKEALSLVDKLTLLDIDAKYAYTLSILGDIMDTHMKLGELEEAKKALDQSNEVTKGTIFKIGNLMVSSMQTYRGYASIAYSHEGALFALSRDFETSQKYFDKAWKIVGNIDPNTEEFWDRKAIGLYYVCYGTFYLGLQGKYQEAAQLVDKGLGYLNLYYLDLILDGLNIETAYIYSGELHLLLKNYDKALSQVEQALLLNKSSHNKVAGATAYTILGQIYFEKGEQHEAERAYETALELTDIMGSESTENWKLFYGLGKVYEYFGNETKALHNYKKAVEEVEKLWKGRFKDTQKQVSFIDNRLSVFEPVIRILSRQDKTEEAFNYMERSKSRAFFETSLFYRGRDQRKANINVEPLTAEEAKQMLPHGTAILEYYVGENSVIGALVTQEGVYVKELAIETKQLKEDVRLFRSSIEELRWDYKEKGSILYAELIRPFEEVLTGIESLCIIPHGVLHYLPFQSLIVADKSDEGISPQLREKESTLMALITRGKKFSRGDQGIRESKPSRLTEDVSAVRSELASIRAQIDEERRRNGMRESRPHFMIDKFKIFYAPSATVLSVASRNNMHDKSRLLTVGSPPEAIVDYEGQTIVLEKLVSAEVEDRQIGSFFSQKAVFTDKAATETIVKDNASEYDVLLFSTHGILSRKDPLKSFIFFNKDANNDGKLTIPEVENMDLRANLVALSACETGLVAGYEGISGNIVDAKFPYGDDLVGLQRAFIKAGASSVLSSLWSVDDDSTAMLIIDFFNGYKTSQDKASALRASVLTLIDDAKGWEHPYYWAPFILSGDWR